MSSASERLARNSNLTVEPPNRVEFDGLVRSGLERLADAENDVLSLNGRFDLAYNAAHALCLAALRHHGFRTSGKLGHRRIVFQVLPDTLGLGPEVWRLLDKCNELRVRFEYEGTFDADNKLVFELIAAGRTVAQAVKGLRARE